MAVVAGTHRALPSCMEEMGKMGVVEKLAKFVPNNLEMLLRVRLAPRWRMAWRDRAGLTVWGFSVVVCLCGRLC